MDTKYPYYTKPEIWGGLECTINRVNNIFRDQLHATGHYTRPGDLEAFAALGIRRLRYPVLWEKHQPVEGNMPEWGQTVEQLKLIRDLDMEPIVGLLHHGSGPVYTDLYDRDFPVKLAAYAAEVAIKFPWIQYYTPVNEPLTTARFSGLYGFWYPHHKNELSFIRILLNQLKGTVLSMQAIRKINPLAKLVQTEDLSKTHSTPRLSYQALFENKRRWLTYDLLCGKVTKNHFFWKYLISRGIAETDLYFFLENSCPPDIMGFNYYVTSERHLDEKIENYPVCTHGGNGKDSYADTEAVRAGQMAGLDSLLKEAWLRYQRPIAITECHLSCTREEQLRWFKETWDTCCRLNEDGIDIRAVTAWSLLGAYDWNSLLTCPNNHYEAGIFDVRNNTPRPTALSKLVHSLASNVNYEHPLLLENGWWKKNDPASDNNINSKAPPLLIIGRSGTLGQAFLKICGRRSIPCIALSREELDISNEKKIFEVIDLYKPWAVINTAGYVRVDDAESQPDKCFAANATGPGLLANACRQLGVRFMTFSSDLVFDGSKRTPYYEIDNVNPLNVYGASKAEGEKRTKAAYQSALIIRSSAFFGPWDKYNFPYHVISSLKKNENLFTASDIIVSPTYIPDLVDTALDLFIDEEEGIWHLSNEGMLTWSDFAINVAERAGYTTDKLVSKPLNEMGWKARRPLYSVLQSEKGIKLPKLDNALQRYFEQLIISV